jgi:hypothetical protein
MAATRANRESVAKVGYTDADVDPAATLRAERDHDRAYVRAVREYHDDDPVERVFVIVATYAARRFSAAGD